MRLVALAAIAYCITGAATPCLRAGNVEIDFDPDVDFKHFKTFSFIGEQELTRTGLLSDPTIRERLKNFIAGAMEPHGFEEVPPDRKYDLAVRYWVARQEKTDETVIVHNDPFLAGYPAYWSGPWGWSYEEYVIHNYVQGTLVVDLIDPTTKDLVWRTFLRQKIEDREKAYQEAKKNLTKSFLGLPPSDIQRKRMREKRAKLEKKYGGS